jgi:hypothetical protein
LLVPKSIPMESVAFCPAAWDWSGGMAGPGVEGGPGAIAQLPGES